MPIKKYSLYALLVLALIGIMQTAIIIVVGLNDQIAPADAIVIFGNTVNTDGTPSPRLQSRLDRGIALFKEHQAPLIVVSGGLGKEGFNEAEVMRDYLTHHDIPKDVIIVDNNGNNSYLTAINLRAIAPPNNIHSVIIVSQYYHILRAKLALHKAGFVPVYTAHARMFPEIRDLYSIPREVIGYYAYLIKNYTTP